MENKDTDQWLSDGNCDYCRREPYCSKDCTVRKRKIKAAMHKLMREFILSKYTGVDVNDLGESEDEDSG